MTSRLQRFRKLFGTLGIDAFIATYPPHVRYLSGFTGSNALCLIGPRSATLITDGRYDVQAREEAHGWNVVITRGNLSEMLTKKKLIRPGWRIGVDGNTIVLSQYRLLKSAVGHARLVPKTESVESLASVKDPDEIRKIDRAVRITDDVFRELLGMITAGITENDIAAEITYRQRKHGAEGDAFEPIVVSGVRGALPHGRASSKKLSRGELLTIDMGCIFQGYHSDMTRTIAIGRPSSEAKKIYQVVLDAQKRALDHARSGLKTSALDAVARGHIDAHGFGKFFQHSLGHGVGLQIHENPRISVQSKAILAAGNVITIEPGIYIPELGGVRIEDIAVIREDGCDVLTRSPKELIIV